MKKVFISATKQNDGKTTVSLGLIANLQKRFKNVGFIKPIGQRYLEEDGVQIDEDSILIEEVCGIKGVLKDMSPVAVERGFTERYIASPDRQAISRRVKEAFKRIAKGKNLVVIEGTGHAGVGSVFDHSNSAVAKLLGSKVIIISSGGVGRPIDEILLNKALFERDRVKVIGVIINKILPQKFHRISKTVRQGLSRKGIDVLGIVPYDPMLSEPTMFQILEETGFKLFSGGDNLGNHISNILVGAMEPAEAVGYVKDKSLIITPGDREDLISAVLKSKAGGVSGIVLTGEKSVSSNMADVLKQSGIPVLLAPQDTYSVVSTIHDLTVKIRPQDTNKINRAIEVIKQYVDFEKILERM